MSDLVTVGSNDRTIYLSRNYLRDVYRIDELKAADGDDQTVSLVLIHNKCTPMTLITNETDADSLFIIWVRQSWITVQVACSLGLGV